LLGDFYDGNDHDLLLIFVRPSENSNPVELMNDIRQVVDNAATQRELDAAEREAEIANLHNE
jgi:hypothetical protein